MRQAGDQAEAAALAHLVAQGLVLVTTNYRSRFGEIDLVLREGDTLVFVEVRMRSSSSFGGAAASITAAKRGRLLKTANQYLGQFRTPPRCRFDVVLLGSGAGAKIEWIKNAITND
jgi:putative endonuclease